MKEQNAVVQTDGPKDRNKQTHTLTHTQSVCGRKELKIARKGRKWISGFLADGKKARQLVSDLPMFG